MIDGRLTQKPFGYPGGVRVSAAIRYQPLFRNSSANLHHSSQPFALGYAEDEHNHERNNL